MFFGTFLILQFIEFEIDLYKKEKTFEHFVTYFVKMFKTIHENFFLGGNIQVVMKKLITLQLTSLACHTLIKGDLLLSNAQ